MLEEHSSEQPALLASWEAIARYLGKSIRTVQRWEATLALPVHRHEDSVFAYAEELDSWVITRLNPRNPDAANAPAHQKMDKLRRLSEQTVQHTQLLRERLESVVQAMNTAQTRIRAIGNFSEGRTILAVDDNEVHNYVLSRILQRSGYRVLRAFTGSQALNYAAENPCLILLDIHLPDLDGFEVCRRLKGNPDTVHIPVVFITATSQNPETRTTAEQVGGKTVLFYPTETVRLLRVISEQLLG